MKKFSLIIITLAILFTPIFSTVPLAYSSLFSLDENIPFEFKSGASESGNILTKFFFQRDYSNIISLTIIEQNKKYVEYEGVLKGKNNELSIDGLKPDINYFFRIDVFSENQLDLIESYSGQFVINATKYNDEIIESEVSLSNVNKLVENEISILATTYESEPNDSPLYANLIYDDDNNYGYISAYYDIDYYKIYFNYDGNANFYLGSIPSGTDYDLYLYNQNLTLIAYSNKGSNIDELISAYPVNAYQWYYIKVVSYSGV